MNLLGLVFGLLLIFTCTFSLSLRKNSLSAHVEKTYTANIVASRDILNTYESQTYGGLRFKKTSSEQAQETPQHEPSSSRNPHLNRDCARLNLWPLLEEDAESHRLLYETAAAFLRTIYGAPLFEGQKRHEYVLLDALLKAAKSQALKNPTNSHLALEKLSLKDGRVKLLCPLQSVYYRMLKGTKKTLTPEDYPSLLDYLFFENKKTKICLKHASVELLSVLFSPRVAFPLFEEIHKSKTSLLQERIEEICRQSGQIGGYNEIFSLLDLQPLHRSSEQKTLIAEEADVCLKKRFFFPT